MTGSYKSSLQPKLTFTWDNCHIFKSNCLFICLSVCLSVCLSATYLVCLYTICLFVLLSVCLSACLYEFSSPALTIFLCNLSFTFTWDNCLILKSNCLFICLSAQLWAHPSNCLSVRLSVHPSVCQSVCPPVVLPACTPCLSVLLSVRPSVCLSIHLPVYLSVCMNFYHRLLQVFTATWAYLDLSLT